MTTAGFTLTGDFDFTEKMRQATLQAVDNTLNKTMAVAQAEARKLCAKNTGETAQRIDWKITQNQDSVDANFGFFDSEYSVIAASLETGSKPHWPPIDAIKRWVHLKQIAGSYSVKSGRRTGGKTTQDKQDAAVAFLIARSISKKGTKAHPFLVPGMMASFPRIQGFLSQELDVLRIK